MSKLNIAGVVCIALGFLVILFKGIASQMGEAQQKQWSEVTIEHWVEPEQLQWVYDIKWQPANKAAVYITETPVYYIFFVLGGIFLIVGSLLWRK